MKRALIYCRVSSQRQVKEGDGLGSQEQRCRAYAISQDYDVMAVFREEGESGGLFDRPAMRQVLKFLDEHNSNNNDDKIVVVFDDLKRFARDTEIHFRLKREIYGRNGCVESPNFRFEDTPDGKFVETVMAATAELERNQNKRQVIQKQQARLERGYWPFMLPKGLINKKDPIHGKIAVAREPYSEIYKIAIEKFAEGYLTTPDEVRLFLYREYKARGISDRPSLSTVQKILREPLYAGYMKYEKRGIPFKKAQHEGFISVETYLKVQERLQIRSKPWHRRDYSADFPLRSQVICSACGTPYTASWNKGRSAKYPNYFCRKKGCIFNWKVINKYKIEAEFEQLLSDLSPAAELVDLTKKVLQEQWEIKLKEHSDYRVEVRSNIAEADERIKRLLGRIIKTTDENLIATYEEEIKRLKKIKEEGERELGRQLYSQEEFGTALEKVFDIIKEPLKMWKSDDYNNKQLILFMYFGEKLKYDYNSGFGTASLAYPVSLITQNPPVTEGICGDVEQ